MATRPSRWKQALTQPTRVVSVLLALLKGHWYRIWYRVLGRRFSAGRKLKVFGSLVIRGPGRVALGDEVVVMGRVTPWTHAPDAVITIGDKTMLDGVRFACAAAITIGNGCVVAESHILDTDFHSTRADRRSGTGAPVRTVPVVIEDNVWVAGRAGLLPGTVIGRNSVVGFGAVCYRPYPPDVILFGNPAKVVAPVLRPDADA